MLNTQQINTCMEVISVPGSLFFPKKSEQGGASGLTPNRFSYYLKHITHFSIPCIACSWELHQVV